MAIENTEHENCPQCDQAKGCCVEYCYRCLAPALDCCGSCEIEVRIAPDRDFCVGTLIAYNHATNEHDSFDPMGSNGLNCPIGIAKYDIRTDANGNHFGGSTGFADVPCPVESTNIYVCGIFESKYVPQYLEKAVATGKVALLSDGLFKLG